MATQLACPHCHKVMEISGAPPAFCAYCGQSLSSSTITMARTPDMPILEADKSTLAPSEATTEQTSLARMPQMVGKYRLMSRLGSGGMGTVYEAEHTENGRRVALKLLSRELAASPDSVLRFRQEGRLASAIAHPRCVFVFAVDEANGQSYIVMELMPGATLRDLVEEKGPLPPDDAIAKILDVIDGLLEAHRLEVIHRDVKPSNCFLEPDGRVKVGDFGLAKSLIGSNKAHLTRTGTFLGTPHFASPEQVRGEPVSPQTDVYSVAATLYYLLTGQPPFPGVDMAATLARIVSDPPPSMRTLRPDIPLAVDHVVLKGLERDRQQRFQDLQELRAALVALLPKSASRGIMARLASVAAGVRELLGRTRVIANPWAKKQAKPLSTLGWFLYLKRHGRLSRDGSALAALPNQLGGFAIRGAIRRSDEDKVLLGEDASLGRRVLIYSRAQQRREIDPKRQTINRTTRVRWLGSGAEKDLRWDAFLAPLGCPLPEVIVSEKRVQWGETRLILEQLSDELAASMADNTLPQHLSCDQVWVQQSGLVQLVDVPPDDEAASSYGGGGETAEARCLGLLRQVAVLALEGRELAVNEFPHNIRAPMPEHARQILRRLTGGQNPYSTIDQFRADLAATADRPTEIVAGIRNGQIALQAALLLPGLLLMFLAGVVLPGMLAGNHEANAQGAIEAYDRVAWSAILAAEVWPFLWVCWAFLARGGISYSLMGISLVDAAGSPAPRWRCALRALIFWAPIMLLLFSTYRWPVWFSLPQLPVAFRSAWLSCWAIIAAILAVCVLRALMWPHRMLHDRLAGIHLVPR